MKIKQNKTNCVLACSAVISFSSLSAIAQTASDQNSTTTDRMAQSTAYDDNQPNYSWLGLLGLFGLAGLLRKREESETNEHKQVLPRVNRV